MLTIIVGKTSLKDIKLTDDMIVCPDAQMHPHEQYEYAKKIVQKAKAEDITIVTFSAIFINALETIGKFFQVKVECYLCEYGTLYLMNDIMYALYNNLGKPFSLIQHIEIDIEFGLDDNHTIKDLEKLEKEHIEWEKNKNNY